VESGWCREKTMTNELMVEPFHPMMKHNQSRNFVLVWTTKKNLLGASSDDDGSCVEVGRD